MSYSTMWKESPPCLTGPILAFSAPAQCKQVGVFNISQTPQVIHSCHGTVSCPPLSCHAYPCSMTIFSRLSDLNNQTTSAHADLSISWRPYNCLLASLILALKLHTPRTLLLSYTHHSKPINVLNWGVASDISASCSVMRTSTSTLIKAYEIEWNFFSAVT